ncbi:hypothetical protein FRX31_003502 [Thalictrum thalictroides]|uniref:Uncharacterized protein n=1 Tax=Thalictrum thalictroides TaxID=46969 RepID=A0A7J6XAU1_THATH|nr:hypothetical protein FRX31_003502 [Thalictrum thalictroides]
MDKEGLMGANIWLLFMWKLESGIYRQETIERMSGVYGSLNEDLFQELHDYIEQEDGESLLKRKGIEEECLFP